MTQTIQQRAAAALAKYEAADKAKKQARMAKDRAELDHWLRENLNVSLAELEADGIKAKLDAVDGNYFFRIRGACPDCGEEVWSTSISDWTQLGRMLTEFVPHPWHPWLWCKARSGWRNRIMEIIK